MRMGRTKQKALLSAVGLTTRRHTMCAHCAPQPTTTRVTLWPSYPSSLTQRTRAPTTMSSTPPLPHISRRLLGCASHGIHLQRRARVCFSTRRRSDCHAAMMSGKRFSAGCVLLSRRERRHRPSTFPGCPGPEKPQPFARFAGCYVPRRNGAIFLPSHAPRLTACGCQTPRTRTLYCGKWSVAQGVASARQFQPARRFSFLKAILL
mmetsp:Transcript_23382/g.59293  ORF Transcript_23382/g.59293 Transcript_23382/m.59293 type:complete len:206 (+) Transcript_23382:525-1142(+)